MTTEQFEKLDEGDIITHFNNGERYMVTANYGGRVTAVATADATNPDEWELVVKVTKKEIRP